MRPHRRRSARVRWRLAAGRRTPCGPSCSFTVPRVPAPSTRARRCASSATATPQLHPGARVRFAASRSTPRPQVLAGLDTLIAELLAETGADKVDLLGHSLGTFLMQTYLKLARASRQGRALRQHRRRHCVRASGRRPHAGDLGDGGSGPADRRRDERVLPQPDARAVGHVGGVLRRTVRVLHRRPRRRPRISSPRPHVQLAGRVVFFPQNLGIDGTVQIFEVNGDTGARLSTIPTPPTHCRARAGPSGPSRPSAAGTTSSSSCVPAADRSTSTRSPWFAATP